MKFPSKIAFLFVLALLLSSTVYAYAFLAPGLTPAPLVIPAQPLPLSLPALYASPVNSAWITSIPDAQPAFSLGNEVRALKLYLRSA